MTKYRIVESVLVAKNAFTHFEKETAMPYIHIRVASESLSAVQIRRLSAGTTKLMAERLRKRPEVTVVTVETLPPDRWFLAGSAIPTPRRGRCTLRSRALTMLACHANSPSGACAAMAEIKITQGTNTAEEKANFLADFHQLLGDCLGPFDTPAYVVIHEVPGGDWGYDGLSQAQRSSRQP